MHYTKKSRQLKKKFREKDSNVTCSPLSVTRPFFNCLDLLEVFKVKLSATQGAGSFFKTNLFAADYTLGKPKKKLFS